MGKKDAPTEQERAAALDTAATDLFRAGDARGAFHAAQHELLRAAKVRRDHDPAGAALLDAALTGVLAAMAAGLPGRKPPKVPGYTGGPPSAAGLLAAYQQARTDTARQQHRKAIS